MDVLKLSLSLPELRNSAHDTSYRLIKATNTFSAPHPNQEQFPSGGHPSSLLSYSSQQEQTRIGGGGESHLIDLRRHLDPLVIPAIKVYHPTATEYIFDLGWPHLLNPRGEVLLQLIDLDRDTIATLCSICGETKSTYSYRHWKARPLGGVNRLRQLQLQPLPPEEGNTGSELRRHQTGTVVKIF